MSISLQLVSYVNGLSNKTRLKQSIEIINESKADIILFSGHTIGSYSDIQSLKTSIKNKRSEIILELQDAGTDMVRNCLYRISAGTLSSLYSNQLFSTSSEIEGNTELADRLVNELESKRFLKLHGFNVLILQCGELNILKNLQAEDNKVEFRLKEDKKLNKRFADLLKQTDIVLNPIHSPMGNQGKMHMRRIFLSKNKKYYFSTSNTQVDSDKIELPSLQFAYYNGLKLSEIDIEIQDNYIIRTYNIK